MKRATVLVIGFVFLYLTTHLYGLTALPIFADEAIYIRWSQLIISDWQQYLFFPLNDGKTPLLIWLQIPFLELISDPLYAVRLVSVLVGLLQCAVLYFFTKAIGGKKVAVWTAALLTLFLPYWYFHHRMGLLDGLLTVWLSVCVWQLWVVVERVGKLAGKSISVKVLKSLLSDSQVFISIVVAGLSMGAALWTKLPAVLILPALIAIVIAVSKNASERVLNLCMLGIIGLIGVGSFLVLSLHPAFPQLFSRGSDFLFPVSQLLTGGVLSHTIPNIPSYCMYFLSYATIPFWMLLVLGLFYGSQKRTIHVLFWTGLLFLLPMFVLGRVVYPRYLLPAMLFFTPAVSLAIESFVLSTQKRKLSPGNMVIIVALCLLCTNIVHSSLQFILPAMVEPNRIPFVSADAEQYLLEWSSGHGILETVSLITEASKTKRIAVATEGYFGTLPDALLVYFFNQNVDTISIDGIGQPVQSIPQSFLDKSQTADERWLVVNSHRLDIANPGFLLAEYCRKDLAPCLQVWRLNE